MTITLTGGEIDIACLPYLTCRGRFASMYMTAQGKALKDEYQWQEGLAQFHGKPLLWPLQREIALFYKTKRKSDWGNFHKLSLDALNGIVWEDDSHVTDATVHRRYDKENHRIEISISQI